MRVPPKGHPIVKYWELNNGSKLIEGIEKSENFTKI